MPRNPETSYFSGLQTQQGWNVNGTNWIYDNYSPYCMPD